MRSVLGHQEAFFLSDVRGTGRSAHLGIGAEQSLSDHESQLSTGELRTVFESFSKAEILRLERAALFFGFRCRTDGDELLDEAVKRALSGRRKCKRGLDPVVFLVGAIRSVTSEINKSRKQDPLYMAMMESSSLTQDLAAGIPSDGGSPEEALVVKENQDHAERTVARLEELFADDDEAQLILMGTMDELTAEEIREIAGMDTTTYASARRRMRRKIDKEFPDGWR